jgi:2,3,4,5-tetrahydropyridine-2-carboxylate N-succinyltransferase
MTEGWFAARKASLMSLIIEALESRLVALEERLADEPGAIRKKPGRVIDDVLEALDTGALRVCEPSSGDWVVHAWVKRAILLSFARFDNADIQERMVTASAMKDALGVRTVLPSYYDKLPTKRNWKKLGARCVPPGVARYGSYLGRGAILMPGFVNIGAYVDDGTMVDTWATVGSCAQIGKGVHLSGGVGIGGVLEPPQAMPVVVEDGAFIGSRCIVVEGVRIGTEAVLGAGVVLTASTPIVDVRGVEPKVTKGAIPPRAVVIPGTLPKRFPAGEFGTPCALIIGERNARTDLKTSLNAVLREFEVAV